MTMTMVKTLSAVALVAMVGVGCGGSDADPTTAGSGSGSGNGSSSSGAGAGDTCPANIAGTSATKITINVSWPKTIGVEAGSGQIIVWTKSDLTFDGNDVSGVVQPCGSVVPPIQAVEAVGGALVQPIIPDEVWDSGQIPTTTAAGTISGTGAGASIEMEPAVALLGVNMVDGANDPWPVSWEDLDAVDADGSGQPGVTSFNNDEPGFSPAPLDIFPDGLKSKSLFLATRSIIELQGTRDSCTTAKGTAIVHAFDNHIVGCETEEGDICTAQQTTFVDTNRTIFDIGDATYEMVQVEDGATCADVRAAVP